MALDLLLGERALPSRSALALADLGICDGVVLTVIERSCPRLLTAALDGKAKLWNAMTGECLHTFSGHSENVLSNAVFSFGGALVLRHLLGTVMICCDVLCSLRMVRYF